MFYLQVDQWYTIVITQVVSLNSCDFSHSYEMLNYFKIMEENFNIIAQDILERTWLTLPWRKSLLYRNQSIDLQSKSMDWFLYILFFYQGFLSRTLTTHRTAGEGRGPFFIPLYHFQSLTNIQALICNFACETTITYF